MADKKVVLQLCHSYGAPFDDVARQWRVLFDPSEYEVVTVFLTGEPSDKVSELVGGEVIYLGYRSKDLRGLKRKQIKDVQQLHAKYNFSLAVAHRYKPIYIATHIKDLPVFGVAHAYGVFEGFWRKRYVASCQQRLTLIGVSHAIRGDIAKTLPAYPEEKLHAIHNHIDTKKYQAGQLGKNAAREALGLPQDAYIVGNVGRLHPDKDQKTLIAGFAKAFPDLDNGLLVVVGDGRLEDELKQQAKELGVEDAVNFLGRVPDAWQYFKAFDVFALTSNYEPFGMVLLEAMIAGVPVISTDVGGAPEVVGEYGELIPLEGIGALAQALTLNLAVKEGGQMDTYINNNFSDRSAQDKFRNIMREYK
ncbi:glycosyltransferase [Maricurvus nonylphenolicus]|uniref:glycosyltransferase n=1 Tax=Maricurvus nonylphenolicus TaxID=1008307 RepID=UPI0036F2B94F